MDKKQIELNKNMREIYYLDLALQGYELHTGVALTELIETINNLNYLRTKRDELDNEKKLELTKIILKGQNNAVDIIGKDKFSFYDDGVIEYTWGK